MSETKQISGIDRILLEPLRTFSKRSYSKQRPALIVVSAKSAKEIRTELPSYQAKITRGNLANRPVLESLLQSASLHVSKVQLLTQSSSNKHIFLKLK